MKYLAAIVAFALALAGPAAALPAQGAQFPPGTVQDAHIGVPAPGAKPPRAVEARAGLDHAAQGAGDCSVKGVSCKETAIAHNLVKDLWLKIGGH